MGRGRGRERPGDCDEKREGGGERVSEIELGKEVVRKFLREEGRKMRLERMGLEDGERVRTKRFG